MVIFTLVFQTVVAKKSITHFCLQLKYPLYLECYRDGILEECDDGNTQDGDICTSVCKNPMCGDGRVSYGEQCDDFNRYNNDGCNNQCQYD